MDNHDDINAWIPYALVVGVIGMIVYYLYISLGFGDFSTQYLVIDFCFGCCLGFIYYALNIS